MGTSNFGPTLTPRPGPMSLPRKPWGFYLLSGLGPCWQPRYVPVRLGLGARVLIFEVRACPPYAGPQHWEAPLQLRHLKLWSDPHLPTGADGFATQTTGRHRPFGAETLLQGQVRAWGTFYFARS